MNYGELKAAVAGYTHRNDMAPLFDTFRDLSEQRIYYGEQNTPALRIPAMEKESTLASGAQPGGYLEAITLTAVGIGYPYTLDYRPLGGMKYERHAYGWDGANLILSDDAAFPISMRYYAKLPTPVLDADTNWILTEAPNIYLQSMLIEAASWMRDTELQARAGMNYVSACSALQSTLEAARLSGASLRQQVSGSLSTRRGY